MAELKLLLFTVPVGFNTFFIRVISAGWIFTTVLFPDAASHVGTEKPPHLMIIFAWDMARGKNALKSGLTCQSLKGSFSWPQILSVCWLNGGGRGEKTFERNKKWVKKEEEKQLGSCSLCPVRRERWLLYRLRSFISYMGTHWISRGQSVGKEKGEGRVWFQSKPIYQWAQTKWPWPALGRSIWQRLTGGFNERNDQSRDHLCCCRAHQRKGNCARK